MHMGFISTCKYHRRINYFKLSIIHITMNNETKIVFCMEILSRKLTFLVMMQGEHFGIINTTTPIVEEMEDNTRCLLPRHPFLVDRV